MSTIVTRAVKGSALTWTEGDANFTNLNNDKIEDIVEDTTPQLGGNLDVQANSITTSTTDGDISIEPNGAGIVIAQADLVVGYGTTAANVSSLGAYDLVLSTNEGTSSGTITITDGTNGNITVSPNGTGIVVSDKSVQLQATSELRFADTDSSNYVGFKAPGTVSTNRIWTLPATDGTAGQLLSTNGSGVLSWATDATGSGGATATTRAVLECSNHNQISGTLYRITFNGTVFHENISPSIITFSDSNNRITLAAGTYMFDQKITRDSTSGFTTTISNISLYNVTDGSSTLTPYERYLTTYFYFKYQKFTIASSKTFEFRYDSSNPVNRSTPDFITLFKIA
jgi:hypothetical protein